MSVRSTCTYQKISPTNISKCIRGHLEVYQIGQRQYQVGQSDTLAADMVREDFGVVYVCSIIHTWIVESIEAVEGRNSEFAKSFPIWLCSEIFHGTGLDDKAAAATSKANQDHWTATDNISEDASHKTHWRSDCNPACLKEKLIGCVITQS